MSTGSPLPAHLWDSLPPEAQALILALQGEVIELQNKIPGLQHRIQELQNPISRDSSNSSAPPSLDPPTAKHQASQSASEGGALLKAELSPRERLRELIHQSPRSFNKPRSTWT